MFDATGINQRVDDSPPQHTAQVPPPLRPVETCKRNRLASLGSRDDQASLHQRGGAFWGWRVENTAGIRRGRNLLEPATAEQFIHQRNTGNASKVAVSSAGAPQGCIAPDLAGGLSANRT